jgi:hypothetical protein
MWWRVAIPLIVAATLATAAITWPDTDESVTISSGDQPGFTAAPLPDVPGDDAQMPSTSSSSSTTPPNERSVAAAGPERHDDDGDPGAAGDTHDATYRSVLTLPANPETGVWKVRQVHLGDLVGNQTNLWPNDLAAAGFPISFEVTA